MRPCYMSPTGEKHDFVAAACRWDRSLRHDTSYARSFYKRM